MYETTSEAQNGMTALAMAALQGHGATVRCILECPSGTLCLHV